MTGIEVLDTAVRSAQEWIGNLMQRLGWHDRERTCLALVAVLHASRDCLPGMRSSIWDSNSRPSYEVSIMKAGIRADTPAELEDVRAVTPRLLDALRPS